MTKYKTSMLLLALMVGNSVFSQTEERSSSSQFLQPSDKADVTIPFSVTAEGKRFEPIWGLDLAWISEQNLKKGVNHMGKENVGIGRTAYRFTHALTNDSVLATSVINVMRQRSNIFNTISPTLPLVFTADQEAGTNEYFVKNRVCDTDRWAAMINSHVHWMQENTQHPIIGVSPFNEPDMWKVEEGAYPNRQHRVAKLLRENYPRFADINIVGANTLNNDSALTWYTGGKQYYEWGNTHQLAGSFNTFAAFYQQLERDGKVGYGDEMHNVGEAMIGLEYGMTVGIWWGFDSRARGEFCDISRNGVRLAYGEHRNNWTAGSVYRHDDGRVKAFIGSSERQAYTTKYQFVSPDREVYYDGYGPAREFFMEMPGGTGYQKGQTNAERVINVTWGEDVQPDIIDGTYKIVNKATGNAVAVNNTTINQQIYRGNATQQWNIHPVSNRIGGDYSFYNIESVSNARIHINVRDFSTSPNADLLAYGENATPTSNEQWYIEYAGDGYYYIRNRESALYMASVGISSSNGVRVTQNTMQEGSRHDLLLWRFLPVDVTFERVAPAHPTGLIALPQQASVSLSWTANSEEDLAGYMVLRAPQGTEEWNTIARKLQTTTYVDNTCLPGTSYTYKVKAIDKAGNISACSETAEAQPTGEKGLVAYWPFEDNLQDATPNMMDLAFKGTPVYATDCKMGAKSLRINDNCYVQLPYEVANSDELTIAFWVKWGVSSNWQRLFDFGNGTEHYMFLTPSNSYTNKMRFAIKNGGDEQFIDCNRLNVGQWKHIAVSIGTGKTAIFVDGVEAASSTGITIKPSDIHPVLNYVGRSQFTADPFFRGNIDDLRIYNQALDAEAVKTLMDDSANGIATATADEAEDNIIYGVDGRQRTGMQRGINIVRPLDGSQPAKKVVK